MHLGQFYLGLGFQVCRSAKLDRPHNEHLSAERGKRLIWSFQSLEQFYSEQHGFLRKVEIVLSSPETLLDPRILEFGATRYTLDGFGAE